MKALVFGANGYLGRHITHAARQRNWDVQTTDIQPGSWNDDPSYRRCDIRDFAALNRDLDWGVDTVFIFGGLSGTVDSFEKFADYIDVNIKGLLGILETIRRTGTKAKVVFPSSRLIYKGSPGGQLAEDDEKQANTIYAASKLAAENYLDLYQRIFGLRYTSFRISVPYGNVVACEYSCGTMEFILRHAQQGEDIPIYGEGLQKRTFSHIEDICEQIFRVISLPESDGLSLNVDGGDSIALCQAAAMVAKKYGVSLSSVPWPDLVGRCETGDAAFNCSAIRQLSGYRCQHTLSDWLNGLTGTQNTEKKNPSPASADQQFIFSSRSI